MLDNKIHTKYITLCMKIINDLYLLTSQIMIPTNKCILVAAVLCVVLEKDGITNSEVLKVFLDQKENI